MYNLEMATGSVRPTSAQPTMPMGRVGPRPMAQPYIYRIVVLGPYWASPKNI